MDSYNAYDSSIWPAIPNRNGKIFENRIIIIITIYVFGALDAYLKVLGLTKSRWHVPVQILASVFAAVGYFLGHAHKGRQFKHNIHSSFASPVMILLIVQIAIGVYLRLHLERGALGTVRRWVLVPIHGVLGKIFPIISWVQMGFGAITVLGFCREDHLGQCLAHGVSDTPDDPMK